MRTRSIDTRYAGCHFRSRLEARWAVFFDKLGVDWQYEPQGFEVTFDDDPDEKPGRYLPDFHLPRLGTYVEVKGNMAERDLRRLVQGVIPHGLSLGATGTPAVIILGDTPRLQDHRAPTHVGLTFHKGAVFAGRYHWTDAGTLTEGPGRDLAVGTDGGLVEWNHRIAAWLTEETFGYWGRDPLVTDAYLAARSARFEFGAAGA